MECEEVQMLAQALQDLDNASPVARSLIFILTL